MADDDNDSWGPILSKLFNGLSKLCAFLLLIAYILFAINANWNFITNGTINLIIGYVMYYGPLVIVSLVGAEFASTKSMVTQIVIYALIAVMIIFQFFPDTWTGIINGITK